MSTLTKDGLASIQAVCMTLYEYKKDSSGMSKASKKQISTYSKGVKFLLNSCALGSYIAKKPLGIACLHKFLIENLVQYFNVFQLWDMSCGNACIEEHTRGVIIGGVSACI